jgi:hypothetical protein
VTPRTWLSQPPRERAEGPTEAAECDVFLSYSRTDFAVAKALAEELDRRGWSVAFDDELTAGERSC